MAHQSLLLLLLLTPASLGLVRIYRLLPNREHVLRDECFDRKGQLAVIENRQAQNQALRAILTQTPSTFLRVRLGAEIFFQDEYFTWVDGGRVAYTNWAPNQPDNLNNRGEKCVEMIAEPGANQGKWNDQLCDVIPMALCEMTSKDKYRILPNQMESLGPLCYANGGRLAEIKSRQESQEAVRFARKHRFSARSMRIGARLPAQIHALRRNRRQFVLSREAIMSFTHWAAGEPNNKKGNEDCVELQLDQYTRWNDVTCNEPHLALCKLVTDYNSTLIVIRNTPESIEQLCISRGGRLMIIQDSVDQDAAADAIRSNYESAKKREISGGADFKKNYQRVLLGARRLDAFKCPEHVFSWVVNEHPLNFTNWMPGEPASHPGKECVAMRTSGTGGWSAVSCGKPNLALCEFEEVREPHKRYDMIYEEGINELRHFNFWEQQCRHRGGLIAKIGDETEQLLAEKAVRRLRLGNEVILLGATQSRYYPRYFSWLDGSHITYSRWVNETRDEDADCITMVTKGRLLGQWRAVDCRAYKALCEFTKREL